MRPSNRCWTIRTPRRHLSTLLSDLCWTRPLTSRPSRTAGPRTPMSDHISGPRAVAEPIADITDVYAFPSPERPGHLVLVMNTLPFAQPGDGLSDGLIYRFRLRPLAEGAPADPVRFAVGPEEFVIDCLFSPPAEAAGGRAVEQEG